MTMEPLSVEMLWRYALAAVPLAVLTALLCRWLPCRPSTRHALWVVILLLIATLPALPLLPQPDLPALAQRSAVVGAERAVPAAPATPIVAPPDRIAAATAPPRSAQPSEETAKSSDAPATAVASSLYLDRSKRPAQQAPVDEREPAHAGGTSAGAALAGATREPAPKSADVAPGVPRPAKAARNSASAPAGPAARHAERAESAPGGSELRETTAAPSPASTPGVFLAQFTQRLAAARDEVMRLPPLPPLIWAAGTMFLLALLLGRIALTRRLLRSAAPAPAEVQRMVDRAAAQLGLRRRPEVRMVGRRISPMICCGRTPRLILPRNLWAQLDDTGREAVLLHELAHVLRGDHWICWIEQLVGCLYWWHPVVWWVRRRIREEADFCCDGWVTALLPRGRRAYAQALLDTRRFISEPLPAAPVIGLGVTTKRAKRFARRLTMILTAPGKPRLTLRGAALAATVAAAAYLAVPVLACPPEKEKSAAPAVAPRAPVATARPARPAVAPPAPRAPQPPPAHWTEAEDETTFESFMRQREGGDEEAGIEQRISELEQQLQRLHRQLERLLQGQSSGGPAPAPQPGPLGVLGIPEARGSMSPSPAPSLPGILRVYSGTGASGSGSGSDCAAVRSRVYELPEGRLEALTDLMALSDVPVLISRVEGGIEVQGDLATHQAFEAFVEMISGDDDEPVISYALPEGRLEALQELMARSDVPVLVELGESEIRVHGTPLEQLTFKRFVSLLSGDQPAGGMGRAAGDEAARAEAEAAAALRADEALRRQAGALDRQVDQQRAMVERQRAELERQIEELQHRAERARAESDELTRASEHLSGERRRQMETEARSVEQVAESLEEQIERLEEQIERLEEQIERIEQQAQEARERAEEQAERGRSGGGLR